MRALAERIRTSGRAFAVDRLSTIIARLALAGRRVIRSRARVRDDVTVTLTTYPARVASLHWTLRSLLTQSVRPRRVVLFLALSEFDGHALPRLVRHPPPLLEIRWVANTRSYKKLLPALDLFPDQILITADDDVIYPRNWMARLLDEHELHSKEIICYRANEIVRSMTGEFEPYMSWPRATVTSDPTRVLPTGVGGVLYPVGSLDPRVLDEQQALALAPFADDFWFKIMALLAGTGARVVPRVGRDLPMSTLRRTGGSLTATNVAGGQNDVQLRALWKRYGHEIEQRREHA